jgi:hypothetical protein
MVVYTRLKRDATKVVNVITKLTGHQPTIWKDGSMYRVQHNEVSQNAGLAILEALRDGINWKDIDEKVIEEYINKGVLYWKVSI